MQLQKNLGANVQLRARVYRLCRFGEEIGRLGARGALLQPLVGSTAARGSGSGRARRGCSIVERWRHNMLLSWRGARRLGRGRGGLFAEIGAEDGQRHLGEERDMVCGGCFTVWWCEVVAVFGCGICCRHQQHSSRYGLGLDMLGRLLAGHAGRTPCSLWVWWKGCALKFESMPSRDARADLQATASGS